MNAKGVRRRGNGLWRSSLRENGLAEERQAEQKQR